MELDLVHETDAQIPLLLHSALGGDQEALGRLLSSYFDQLYHTAFRVLGTHEDAEDALQDGLLAACRNLRTFQGRSKFSTWLTRIVLNAALMRLRRTRGHQFTSIDQEPARQGDLPLSARIIDPRPSPEVTYAKQERFEIFEQNLASLPTACRLAVWLRYVRGMSIAETAATLKLSVGTVKSRLHRARLKISNHFRTVQPSHIGKLNSRKIQRRKRHRKKLYASIQR